MGEYRYQVVASSAVTPVIRELWLAPSTGALAYRAGQYALLSDVAHRLPPRSYSIANAPRADGRISMLVTHFPGGPTSGWVHETLKPADEVNLDGPYGAFVCSEGDSNPILLLAGGSGLAPARAIAESVLGANQTRHVILFFSVRTSADAIDHARFESWERVYPSFRFLLTLTRDPIAPRNRRIPELLPLAFESLRGWSVFIAGPTGFVTGCSAAAIALGAAPASVHTEEFFADPQPWIEAPTLPSNSRPSP